MTKIFSKEELIEFNQEMIRRGEPNQHDRIGYNKADSSICTTYYYGLSDAQYADLAKRLVKYCKTQLMVDRDDMVATFRHFTSLSLGKDRNDGISVSLNDDSVILSFTYNERFIQTVRKLPIRRYDKEMKKWIVPIDKAEEALLQLEKAGADIKNSLNYIREVRKQTLKGVG